MARKKSRQTHVLRPASCERETIFIIFHRLEENIYTKANDFIYLVAFLV